jgi:hypothetical protein
MDRQGTKRVEQALGWSVVVLAVVATLAACTPSAASGTTGCANGPAGATPACTQPPTAPPGVAGMEAAIARARSAAGDSGGSATVVWATVERAGTEDPPGHDWLWVVRLQGEGLRQSPCPSGYLDGSQSITAPPCLDGDGGLDVVMDAFNTQVLGTWH